MTAIIILEDGRALDGSNIGMAGMLETISKAIGDTDPPLSAWLFDMSNRTSPFFDFDIRSLQTAQRRVFFQAAERDLQRRIAMYGRPEDWGKNHYSGHCLIRLLKMQESITRGEPPGSMNDFDTVFEFDGNAQDLSDLWFPEKLRT